MAMAEMEKHPDSYMNDGPFINKLLIPNGNLTYEQVATQTISVEEKKIINDFVYLLEKSKQLFQQLRHLPQHGHYNWQVHFSRTFDCFSKLWKFQQDHRSVLDTKYGLQRWQIGEIASRIGQLYYHYYLRTSDTNYLHEALIFYLAIRQRDYYSKFDSEHDYVICERPLFGVNTAHSRIHGIMVKKLRYYARFLVVSIMVNKMDLVLELKTELAVLIDELSGAHIPTEVDEWKGILNEVTAFRSALCHLTVSRADTSGVILSHRLISENMVLPEITLSPNPLKLQHALIVGTKIGQPKVTELSLDMYRMGSILEKNPKCLSPLKNPIKQYLYKPSASELMCSLSEMGSILQKQSVQLIYLSGNNLAYTDRGGGQDAYTSDGGMHFSHKNTVDLKTSSRYSPDLLHAEDINPFLRYPTLLIVEGEDKSFFNSTSAVFRQPVVVLLSPKLIPHTLKGDKIGSLMTLFLHCPMMAMTLLCNIDQISDTQWRKGLAIIKGLLAEILTIISSSKNIHSHIIQLLDDPFIRLILLRFCLFTAVLQMHTAFKTEEYYPTSLPSLKFAEICSKPVVKRGINDIANILESVVLFSAP
ncbi:protein SCAI-like [Bolinopsis microptera]|uniref:protein SCAI-like n=1 Tax=Bolinopsis microptera TaxID=2820187 RepID=UPI00307A55E8